MTSRATVLSPLVTGAAATLNCYQPIKVLNSFCPKCKWHCCQPECVGLRNPQLHDIECALLRGGLGVKHESDYGAVRAYYRTDVLFAIKCLLLQLKHPPKVSRFDGPAKPAREAAASFM